MTPPMTHHSEPAREAVASVDVAYEMRHYMQSGDKVPSKVIARWRGLLNKLERLSTSPAPAAGGLEAVQALDRLEKACDGVAATRSQATYLAMIDNDNAEDALQELDHARRAAREIVRAAVASPAATSAETQGGDGVREAWRRPEGGLNADWIAMVLAEDARIEDGRLANGPYLAVKIAEAADLPENVARLRRALANIRDHTRETSTATMALGALAALAPSTSAAARGDAGFKAGLDAAAEYLLACNDYGDRHKAGEIRKLAPPAPAVESAQVKEALRPFVDALDGADDDKAGDGAHIWEAPVAMNITYGDLRRAAKAFASLDLATDAEG